MRMVLMILKQLILSLIVCLLVSPSIPAQDFNAHWRILQSIPLGQPIIVKTSTGKSLKGIFQRITDAALELHVNGKNVDLPSADVSRIYVVRGHHAIKGLLIGAASGTAAGAVIGTAGCRENTFIFSKGVCVSSSAAFGFVTGSITGLTVGWLKHKKDLVYEAPRAR
jgi:hypothetical protein